MAVSSGRRVLVGGSFLILGVLALGQPSLAHETPDQCGGVSDGGGNPLKSGDGGIVLHAGSGPCPEETAATPAPAPEADGPMTATIYFDYDEATPNSVGEYDLAKLIEILSANAPSSVSVAGHADRSGSDAYNDGLSTRRADNVADALVAAGVPAATISTEAFGESAPAIETEDGVRQGANRRVEVEAEF